MMKSGTSWWKDLRTSQGSQPGEEGEEGRGLLRPEQAEDEEAVENPGTAPSQYGGVGR
jgi:hypothetical protein